MAKFVDDFTCWKNNLFFIYNTIKTTHAVTCIKRSHFFCPVTENFIRIELLFKRSPVLKDQFFFPKVTSLYRFDCTFHLDNFIFLAKIFFKGILSKKKLLEYKDVKTVLAFQICNGKTLQNFWCLVCIIYPPSFWHWFV